MNNPRQILTDNLPTVTIIGRANVGKSTLFNRLIEEHKAIVSEVPGTTRTNNEGLVLWQGKYFRLIDTGGLTFSPDIPLEEEIFHQAEMALKQADLILFVTDAQGGILPQEKELAKKMRRVIIKPVVLVANKVDTKKWEMEVHSPEWAKLGLGQPFAISAANGRQIGDLLELIHKNLRKAKKAPKKKTELGEKINISIIGRPNVGKSSLFNKLIGQEKVIVSDLAHTTREPHDTLVTYEHQDKKYLLNFVDTAGIRRKAKVEGQLERQGIRKSLETVEEADIVLFLVDGAEPISSQDMQLAGLLEKHSKSVILIINKWDLAEERDDQYRNAAKTMVYEHFPHLNFAPLIFVSAKTGYRVADIFPLIIQAATARQTEVPEEALRLFLHQITKTHRPARGRGTRQPEILRLRQLRSNPPIFDAFIKSKTSLHRSYLNFMENKLRERFNFFATPIVIKLSKQKR